MLGHTPDATSATSATSASLAPRNDSPWAGNHSACGRLIFTLGNRIGEYSRTPSTACSGIFLAPFCFLGTCSCLVGFFLSLGTRKKGQTTARAHSTQKTKQKNGGGVTQVLTTSQPLAWLPKKKKRVCVCVCVFFCVGEKKKRRRKRKTKKKKKTSRSLILRVHVCPRERHHCLDSLFAGHHRNRKETAH